jgi:hypothetical protein
LTSQEFHKSGDTASATSGSIKGVLNAAKGCLGFLGLL